MKNLNADYFNPFFSHIYVEKAVRNHPRTKEILAKFPGARVIFISHYKDVFCRSGQNCVLQRRTQNLILAAKEGNGIYHGSPVCQSFGNDYFYYTSCIMNCIYDCEYCYLKGMYPSANIVMFVNIEDIFAQAEQILKEHGMYLCVSYDTDLPALEHIAGYVRAWNRFAAAHQDNLTVEVRTKCADTYFLKNTEQAPNMIYAFTLSPESIAHTYEHHTPSFRQRLCCAADAVRAGCQVRLCFDPMLYISGWQRQYEDMFEEVFRTIAMENIVDVSVGTFRISQDYLKKMRKQQPDSAVVWFPYEKENGFYCYPNEIVNKMERFAVEKLKEKVPEDRIFLWRE